MRASWRVCSLLAASALGLALGASCARIAPSSSTKSEEAGRNDQAGEEAEKETFPFPLEAPRQRRRMSERVVLLELFTGAQCPPCVAADIAFDAVLQTYKPDEVVLLQYHLHIPGPDPLTNADSEAREKYYGEAVDGTPTVLLDGKPLSDELGGRRNDSKASYDTLRKRLDEALAKNAGGRIKLEVRRTGDNIDMESEVADLEKTGDRVRLRFALVEEVVRYAGRNGQRLHHHVVRSFPGGVNGFALLDTPAKKKTSVNLAGLKKTVNDFLNQSAKERPFPDNERPLNLKRLKVIAFVQDEKSKEVYQAAQADVPEAK